MRTLAIVDYGCSNLRSQQNAWRSLGVPTQLVTTPEDIRAASVLCLPGVGQFGYACERMDALGLRAPLVEAAQSGKPLLGVCLGMQLLFKSSAENNHATQGLGIFPGQVEKLTAKKLPHTGWNRVASRPHPLLNTAVAPHAYFVHSYHCRPAAANLTIGTTEYEGEFTCIVAREHIAAMQFHPEKSGDFGLAILQNFRDLYLR